MPRTFYVAMQLYIDDIIPGIKNLITYSVGYPLLTNDTPQPLILGGVNIAILRGEYSKTFHTLLFVQARVTDNGVEVAG